LVRDILPHIAAGMIPLGTGQMAIGIGRRQFITALGTAAAWPLVARAQQPERMRRVGILMAFPESDPEGQIYVTAFVRGLRELGWMESGNIRIDYRWAGAPKSRRA
jgi:hypothetical protein